MLTNRPARYARRHGRTAIGGFSLIELMIAMAIGVILMIALTDLLVDVKTTFVREDQFARLQEAARLSTLIASRHQRSSRSLGCRSVGMVEYEGGLSVNACKLIDGDGDCAAVGRQSVGHFVTMDRALGYDNNVVLGSEDNLYDLPPDGAENISARWLRGDILVTWGVDGEAAAVTDALGMDGSGQFQITPPTDGLAVGKLALITDCVGADLFEISGPDDLKSGGDYAIEHKAETTVNASNAFARAYNWSTDKTDIPENPENPDPEATKNANDAQDAADVKARRLIAQPVHRANVYPFSYNAYYICCVDTDKRSLQDQDPEDADDTTTVANCRNADLNRYRPSLCVWSLETGKSQPLITDVADMRVTYTGHYFDYKDKGNRVDFNADDTSPVPTAAWVSEQDEGQGVWANVRSAAVELLVATGQDGVGTKSKLPTNDAWPPSSDDADKLGADIVADDTRLYKRIVINVATRSRTPWYIAP